MEKLLETEAVIGYKGDVIDGLVLHPDNEHILFPLGSTVIVRHIISRTQTFLKGHDNEITAMACSKSGKYVASGQKTYQGLKADIIIWNFADRSILQRLSMHKVCINSLAFSPNDKFLASVGGLDDKNTLIIWDLEQSNFRFDTDGKPSYGSSLGNKEVSMIKFYNKTDFKLCASTSNTVQILTIDPKDKKIRLVESNLGNIKRSFNCVSIDSSDEFVYAGTKTGDILEIDLDKAIFKRVAPSYNLFSMGVRVIHNMPNKDLLIGAGDGTLAKISIQNMMIKTATLILGSISSIAMTADSTHFEISCIGARAL